MMWQATLRDLQWRRRRFLIAITGTALVFAMSLLMSGLSASFTLETDASARVARRATSGSCKEGASGPFTAFSPIPATDAERVAAVDGITAAQTRSSTSTRPSVTSRRTSTSSASCRAASASPR